MRALSPEQSEVLRTLAGVCAEVPGVQAVALGGSHARGRARADSDLDIMLLYRRAQPFPIAGIRAIAERFNDTPSPAVAGIGDWGPWVDGGAWLTVRGQRADLLYRSSELVEETWHAALGGQFDLHHGQQPPFGFFGPTVLGEVTIAQPLFDPSGELSRLKSLISHYPAALKQNVVQASLWDAEFGLTAFAPKYAAAGNAYGAAGCFARAGHRMVLALFALNETWFLNDKTALDEICAFAQAPPDFAARMNAALGQPGTTPVNLHDTLAGMIHLLRETATLAGDLYRRSWNF